jgi:hypothetical protein
MSLKSSALILIRTFEAFGIDLVKLTSSLSGLVKYPADLLSYIALSKNVQNGLLSQFLFRRLTFYPVLHDHRDKAGVSRGHYFHQDLSIANAVFHARPSIHLDIGSRIDGFVSHLLSFDQRVELADIRPLASFHPLVNFREIDLSKPISTTLARKFDSISCLHALEHIGLGRYGDPVDPLGHLKAIKNLSLLLSINGFLYLSFPIATSSRVDFNAHRVFSLKDSYSLFKECGLRVVRFIYVNDNGDLVDPSVASFDLMSVLEVVPHLNYGCGIWTLCHENPGA